VVTIGGRFLSLRGPVEHSIDVRSAARAGANGRRFLPITRSVFVRLGWPSQPAGDHLELILTEAGFVALSGVMARHQRDRPPAR